MGAAMKDPKWTVRPLTPEENERLNRNREVQKAERAMRELEAENKIRDNGKWLFAYFAVSASVIGFLLWEIFRPG